MSTENAAVTRSSSVKSHTEFAAPTGGINTNNCDCTNEDIYIYVENSSLYLFISTLFIYISSVRGNIYTVEVLPILRGFPEKNIASPGIVNQGRRSICPIHYLHFRHR